MASLAEVTHWLRWLGAFSRKLRRKRGTLHVQHSVQVCSLLCTVVGISEKCLVFRGGRAFSDAADCFEEMKADAEMRELWLLRWDGDDWKFQACIRRNADKQWENIPYGAGN